MLIPRLLIGTMLGSLCLYSASCDKNHPTTHTATEQPNRHVPLEGQPNFRDLGGYKTSDGKTIVWHKLYRTGSLKELSDADVEKLDDLGIKTVVNFLSDLEVKSEDPDRVPEGTKEIHIPIDPKIGLGEEFMHDLMSARKTGDFSKIPASVNPEIHRALVTDANKEYTRLLNLLAEPSNYPLAFHCSHGVHRTGTASAIILSALGVPWETIQQDYVLSRKLREKQNTKRINELTETYAKSKGIKPEEVDATDIKAFYLLETDYIDGTLEQAVKDYGSMGNYIRNGLGIDEATLTKIKANLLTK
ncbi:tyrosine-protein phosphatase [Rubritalea tangerina]|uniref:Tyrosine-protein phosphatase n=1 Tax=Rubritalea tangerina TaxID=430798 RepID=A0ABW4ZE20_9BACT